MRQFRTRGGRKGPLVWFSWLVFLLSVPGTKATSGLHGPKIGDVPPPLTISQTLQGPPASEISWDRFKGKVVVLEFWATWCGPCVRAIPHLNELVDQFRDKPVVFLSVSDENEGVVKAFLSRHPIKAWIGLDDYEVLKKAFDVRAIPHVVIVNAEGRIAAIAHPASVNAQHLEEVLAGKKCSLPEPEVYATDGNSSAEVTPSQAPPLFEISIRPRSLPRRVAGGTDAWSRAADGGELNGQAATIESTLRFVFDKSDCRVILGCKLPDGFFDFRLKAPSGHARELEDQFIAALRTTFGLEVKRTLREMDAYILTQASTNAPGFRRVAKPGGGGGMRGGFRLNGCDMKIIVGCLEDSLGQPVFDETGLQGLFAVDMKWELSEAEQLRTRMDSRVWRAIEANPNGAWIAALPPELREGTPLQDIQRLKQELAKPEWQQFKPDPAAVVLAARTRLGLQLSPVRRGVEVLEVRKTGQPDS